MLKKYWLCCGSQDVNHNKRQSGCSAAETGHPERCRFGDMLDHKAWSDSLTRSTNEIPDILRGRANKELKDKIMNYAMSDMCEEISKKEDK